LNVINEKINKKTNMKTKQNKKARRKQTARRKQLINRKKVINQISKGLLFDWALQVLPNCAYYLSKMNFLREEKDLEDRIFLFHKDFFDIVHESVLLEGVFKHDLNGEIATLNHMLIYFIDAIGIDLDILFKMDYDEVPNEKCEVADNYIISKSICYLSIVIITNLLRNEKYKQNNKIFSDYIKQQQRRMKLERLGELAA